MVPTQSARSRKVKYDCWEKVLRVPGRFGCTIVRKFPPDTDVDISDEGLAGQQRGDGLVTVT